MTQYESSAEERKRIRVLANAATAKRQAAHGPQLPDKTIISLGTYNLLYLVAWHTNQTRRHIV